MDATAGQLPDQPAVDGSGEQSAVARDEGDLGLLEQPLDLGCREVGVWPKPGALGNEAGLAAQLCAPLRGTAVLPDDRPCQRLPRIAMPQHYGLALIRDAEHIRTNSARRDRFTRGQERALENLFGIVLNPAGLWIMLGDLLISSARDATIGRDHERGRSSGPLIDRQDVLHPRIIQHEPRDVVRRSTRRGSR